MQTITTAFNFRSFPLVAIEALPKGVKPATKEQAADYAAHTADFENVQTSYTINGVKHTIASAKRKAVTAVSINVPSVSDIADSKMLAAIVQDAVRGYVKEQYIDKFLPVGAHDWQAIETAWLAAQESSGGFGACEFNDDDFAQAQALFSAYLDKVAPKFAPHCTKVIANRAAKRQVEGALKAYGYQPNTIEALLNRMVQAIEQGGNDNAIGALAYCAERTAGHLETSRLADANASDM